MSTFIRPIERNYVVVLCDLGILGQRPDWDRNPHVLIVREARDAVDLSDSDQEAIEAEASKKGWIFMPAPSGSLSRDRQAICPTCRAEIERAMGAAAKAR